jgi:hypothetical protein
MRYFCIAQGMADCTPDRQDYYAAADANEQREIVAAACAEFDREESEGQENGEPYRYPFHLPLDGVNNYSQRLRISRGPDYVLDVIGMTADEYEREQGE